MALLGPRKVYFTGISRPYPLPPGVKIDTLGWRQKARAECIDSVINSAFRQVVISDESEDEVEVDKNERGPNLKETLEMLEKFVNAEHSMKNK